MTFARVLVSTDAVAVRIVERIERTGVAAIGGAVRVRVEAVVVPLAGVEIPADPVAVGVGVRTRELRGRGQDPDSTLRHAVARIRHRQPGVLQRREDLRDGSGRGVLLQHAPRARDVRRGHRGSARDRVAAARNGGLDQLAGREQRQEGV